MSQTRGMAYLRRKLELKRSRVLTRYKYYEMKNAVKDFGMVTPPEFRTFSEVLGWCGKAVDSLADRLIFREFRQDNFDLNSIYRQNNADILFDSAVLSALISSCSFLYICAGEDGFPPHVGAGRRQCHRDHRRCDRSADRGLRRSGAERRQRHAHAGGLLHGWQHMVLPQGRKSLTL